MRFFSEHVFNFSLRNCCISLKSILKWSIFNFNVCIETRPSAMAYTVAARTERLTIETDMPDLPAATILSSNNLLNSKETSLPDVFRLVFEKNPMSTPTDFKLEVQLLPLQIHYHEPASSELLDFLLLPQMDVLEVTWGFIHQTYQYANQFSRFIQNCLSNRVLCDLNINLANPCFLVGQVGQASNAGSTLVIDFGQLVVGSAMVEEPPGPGHLSPDDIQQKVYDRFLFTFSGIQVVLLPLTVPWATVGGEPSSEHHLVPRTKIKLTLSTSVLQMQEIPAWKVEAYVKCAKLCLSDSKLSALIDFLRDLPLPSRCRGMAGSPGSRFRTWTIDKRWVIPNIGKLELLYLESQLGSEGAPPVRDPRNHVWLEGLAGRLPGSQASSAYSIASDMDIKQYCRAIDLPGFEDNISPGNPMWAAIQLSVGDVCLVFDRASGDVSRSYLYLKAEDFNFDIGLMEHGPAVQMSVRSVRLTDRQSRTVLGHDVELLSVTGPGEVSRRWLYYR
jgi:hypothetical protein